MDVKLISILLPLSPRYFNSFYDYPGTVRPTDQETVMIEKMVYFLSQIPRGGGMLSRGGHMGKHQGCSGGRGRGDTWTGAFIVDSAGRNG